MKHFIFLLLIFLTSNAFSQSKTDSGTLEKLKGVWVKTTNSPDTLKFSTRENLDYSFELRLGQGTTPPHRPEGLYQFRILMSVMLIHWTPSSNSFDCPAIKYYFDKNGNFCIDNFYSADKEDKILTFKKLNN